MTDFSEHLADKTATTFDRLKGANLYLVGMMGSGKSTIGRLLAKQIGYRFFDSDTLIERVAGQTVSEIFAQSGEVEFRQLETQVLSQLAACPRSVIATGGGVVLDRQNWSYLHHGVVVWLNAPVEVLHKRLQGSTSRPLLQTENLRIQLETLLKARSSLYALADVQIPILTAEEPPQRVVARVVELVGQALRSDQDYS